LSYIAANAIIVIAVVIVFDDAVVVAAVVAIVITIFATITLISYVGTLGLFLLLLTAL